jgi:hypothetical protein
LLSESPEERIIVREVDAATCDGHVVKWKSRHLVERVRRGDTAERIGYRNGREGLSGSARMILTIMGIVEEIPLGVVVRGCYHRRARPELGFGLVTSWLSSRVDLESY